MSETSPDMHPVPFADGYFVTRDGRVFSEWKRGHRGQKAGLHEMRLRVGTTGYWTVTLTVGNRPITMKVHRIVCATFNGPPPSPDLDVRHKDDVRTNNSADNLEWGTRRENIGDMMSHGRQWLQRRPDGFTPEMRANMSRARVAMLAAHPERIRRGSHHHAATVTEETVLSIRARIASGERQSDIAEDLGLSRQTVNSIHRKKTWRHV